MHKTTIAAIGALFLVGIALAPTGTAYGGCAGVCVEAYDDDGDGEYTVQTCTGNVVVQVGLDNEAKFCNNGSTGSG